jgi:hypothetical protein
MKNSTWITIFILTQIMALFLLFVGNFESKTMHNAIGVVTLINTVGIVWMVLRILKSPQ